MFCNELEKLLAISLIRRGRKTTRKIIEDLGSETVTVQDVESLKYQLHHNRAIIKIPVHLLKRIDIETLSRTLAAEIKKGSVSG